MEIIFNDLHDEAVAAIEGGDKEQKLFSSALKEEDRKISEMFQHLVTERSTFLLKKENGLKAIRALSVPEHVQKS